MPAGWFHGPQAGMLTKDGWQSAFLFDQASAHPCDGMPDTLDEVPMCTHDGATYHRFKHAQLVLEASDSQLQGAPDVRALVDWFKALPEGTVLEKPVALLPLPPPDPVPPIDGVGSPPIDYSSYRSHGSGIGLGHGGPAGHYEFLARYNWASLPIDLEYLAADEPNHVAWYREQVFGGTIIEHGTGIISKINALFLAGAGARWYQNTSTGEVFHENSDVAMGQEASWTVDAGSKYWGFAPTRGGSDGLAGASAAGT